MKQIKILLSVFMIFTMLGCQKKTINDLLLDHNIDAVCDELDENKGTSKSNDIKKDVVKSYYKLLSNIYTSEMDLSEINLYKKDIYHLMNNTEFMIEKDNYFSNDLDSLYDDFSSLYKNRGEFDLIKKYYKQKQFSKMNDILSCIPLDDKYLMKRIFDFTKDDRMVTLEHYKTINAGYPYSTSKKTASDLEITLKNHGKETIKYMSVLILYYKNNGQVINVEYPQYDNYKFIDLERIYPFDNVNQKEIVKDKLPYSGPMNTKISVVLVEYSSIIFAKKNERMYLELFEEIIKNKLKIPTIREYHYYKV